MIQTIIFDCFGVLVSDGWLPFKRKYFGNNPELLEQAGDLNKQVDAGLADYDEFVQKVADLAGIPEPEARKQIDDNPADSELLAFIARELKPHYRLGMLSNAGANWLPQMLSQEQIAQFDAIVLSYEIGVTKPDPKAYAAVINRLHVRPEECVFIDDQERYVTAAQEMGMQGIVYENFHKLRTDLEKMLGLRLAK